MALTRDQEERIRRRAREAGISETEVNRRLMQMQEPETGGGDVLQQLAQRGDVTVTDQPSGREGLVRQVLGSKALPVAAGLAAVPLTGGLSWPATLAAMGLVGSGSEFTRQKIAGEETDFGEVLTEGALGVGGEFLGPALRYGGKAGLKGLNLGGRGVRAVLGETATRGAEEVAEAGAERAAGEVVEAGAKGASELAEGPGTRNILEETGLALRGFAGGAELSQFGDDVRAVEKQMNLLKKMNERLGIGSAKAKLERLPPLLDDAGEQLKSSLKLNEKDILISPKQILTRGVIKEGGKERVVYGGEVVDTILEKYGIDVNDFGDLAKGDVKDITPAIRREIKSVWRRLDKAKRGGMIPATKLQEIKTGLHKDLIRAFNRAERGGAELPGKERVLRGMRDAIDKTLKGLPDGIGEEYAAANREFGWIYDATEALVKKADQKMFPGSVPFGMKAPQGIADVMGAGAETIGRGTRELMTSARESVPNLPSASLPDIGMAVGENVKRNVARGSGQVAIRGVRGSEDKDIQQLERDLKADGVNLNEIDAEQNVIVPPQEEKVTDKITRNFPFSKQDLMVYMIGAALSGDDTAVDAINTITETLYPEDEGGGLDLTAAQKGNLAKLKTAEAYIDSVDDLYAESTDLAGGLPQEFKPTAIISGLLRKYPGRWAGLAEGTDTYEQYREALKPVLARTLGEVGNLSEKEQEAAIGLLPSATDTHEQARNKLRRLKQQLRRAQNNVLLTTQLGETQSIEEAQALFEQQNQLPPVEEMELAF